MAKIVEVYEKMKIELDADPRQEKQLHVELAKIVSACTTQSMMSDEGYCFKFNLPISGVNKLPKLMNLTTAEIYDAFKSDWGSAAMTNNMYKDPYYQILLTIMFFGLKEEKPQLYENAFLIIFFKLWNGRKTKFVKYCDKRIMNYVVSQMCTNKHLFAKYDDPLSMLKLYFVPSLLKKYKSDVKKDPAKYLQRLFSQAWGRLNQQWVSNKYTDMKTGKRMARGGILPMYMEAKEKGLSMSASQVQSFDEDTPAFDEYTTMSNRDEIITNACDFITMNPSPSYHAQTIQHINKDMKTNVSRKVIEKLLLSLHNHANYDVIHDILGIILSNTNVTDKSDICVPKYEQIVKRKVVSSKNSSDSKKLQVLTNKLLEKVFERNFPGVDFRSYSNVHQIQIRAVLIYGIVYNLRKATCR